MIFGIQNLNFKSQKLKFAIVMTDNFSIDSILSSKNEIETGTFTDNLIDAHCKNNFLM